MAGSFITVTPSGHEQVLELLQQLYDKTNDLSPVLIDIGEELLSSHKERWKEERAPDGTPWLPLAPETIKAKGFDLILREHDYLRDMLNYQVDPLALYFGTPMAYGEYHQFGFGVPERPWLGATDDDKKMILDIVAEYLLQTE